MARVKVHHHPCQDCGMQLECGGTWEENDGIPDVICPEFHLPGGVLNSHWLCDDCERTQVEEANDYL